MRQKRRRLKFGRVEIRRGESSLSRAEGPKKTEAADFRVARFTPVKALRDPRSRNLSVEFRIYEWPARGRMFVGLPSLPAFALTASVAGHWILRDLCGDPEPDALRTYDAMRLVYQLAPRLREHHKRNFVRIGDFFLENGRSGESILPPTIGLGKDGSGQVWDPPRLIEEGEKIARGHGWTGKLLNAQKFIALGFLEAARRDPIDPASITEEEALTLVRMALFDLGPALNTTRGQESLVEQRLLEAIGNHLDDTTEDFNRWFFENLDSVVYSIAKRKDGGTVPRKLVRRVVIDLVFKAFRYMAQCVDLVAQVFPASLPKGLALTHRERKCFDFRYRKQKWLGGLCMFQLEGWHSFLNEFCIMAHIIPDDPALPGVLLRLLSYYGFMVSKRREADRLKKANNIRRNAAGLPAREVSLTEQTEPSNRRDVVDDQWQRIVEELRARHGIQCRCGDGADWRGTLAHNTSTMIDLELGCVKCGAVAELTVSRTDFAEIGNA